MQSTLCKHNYTHYVIPESDYNYYTDILQVCGVISNNYRKEAIIHHTGFNQYTSPTSMLSSSSKE